MKFERGKRLALPFPLTITGYSWGISLRIEIGTICLRSLLGTHVSPCRIHNKCYSVGSGRGRNATRRAAAARSVCDAPSARAARAERRRALRTVLVRNLAAKRMHTGNDWRILLLFYRLELFSTVYVLLEYRLICFIFCSLKGMYLRVGAVGSFI